MSKVIMIGCDLHDRSMLLRWCVDQGEPKQQAFVNDAQGREKMILAMESWARQHQAQRVVFVYEASGQGYGLCDQLHDAGIECHVLSPSHLPKTAKSAKNKTDPKDAQMLLETVRGFVLAGNTLPVVWTPPQRLRDDRELVRARVDLADQITRTKLQILSMLKRRGISKPAWCASRWTRRYLQWLREEAAGLDPVVRPVLEGLIARYQAHHQEQLRLEAAIRDLSQTDRYRVPHRELRRLPGVGLVSAMTFLTEMGDLFRFQNRRQVAAYLGLAPSSHESGETSDRKGRITRQGPARLRKMLCQAAWVSLAHCAESARVFDQIRGGRGNRTKKALVALMRRLAVLMWHRGQGAGVSDELVGRGGPHCLPPPQPHSSPPPAVAP